MVTLTKNWQELGQAYLGTYQHDMFVRIYAQYTSQDIANNRTYVKYQIRTFHTAIAGYSVYDNQGTCSVSGSGASAKNTACVTITAGEKTWATTEGWVSHNADGSASISCSATVNWPNWGWRATATGSASLPSIPRKANITSANNFTDIENPSFNYSNPAGNSVTSLQAGLGWSGGADIAYRDIPKSGSTYTFQLTSAERELIRKNCATSNSMTITYYLKTVLGGKTYQSTIGKTCTIVNAEPQLEVSARENNPRVKELTGSDNTLISGYADVSVKMTSKTFKHAAIAQTTISADSEVIQGTEGNFKNVVSGLFVFTVEDSRGNITKKDIKFNVVDYLKLTCNLDNITLNVNGEAKLVVSGNYFNKSFGKAQNTLTLEYRYKEEHGQYGAWTRATVGPTEDSYNTTIIIRGLDYKKPYTFQVRATDLLGTVAAQERTAKALPVFDWGRDDFNFNVPVTFQGKTLTDLIYPVGSIYMSMRKTSPEILFGGTWERIQDTFLLAAGPSHTAGTTGGEEFHVLLTSEMPRHYHNFKGASHTFAWGQNVSNNVYLTNANAAAGRTPGNNAMTSQHLWTSTENTGSGLPHNNMPPYLTVYMWERTA